MDGLEGGEVLSYNEKTIAAASNGSNYSFAECNSEGIRLKVDLCKNGAFYIESLGSVSLNGSLFIKK